MALPPAHYQFELVSFLHPSHPAGCAVPTVARVNSDLHLIHTVQGQGWIHVGAAKLQLSPRQVIFVPPFVRYWCEKAPGPPLEMINFHFHLVLHDGQWLPAHIGLPVSFAPADLGRIRVALRQWHGQWTGGDSIGRSEVGAHLLQLLNGYLRAFGSAVGSEEPGDADMLRLRQRLQTDTGMHYEAERCSVELGLSVSQMNRRFRRLFGESPKTCWQRAKLSRVQTWLRGSERPLEEIAQRCGFSDAFYLSRWFKRWAGVSPSQFRRESRLAAM